MKPTTTGNPLPTAPTTTLAAEETSATAAISALVVPSVSHPEKAAVELHKPLVEPSSALPPSTDTPATPSLFALPGPLTTKQTAKRMNKAVEDTIALRKHHWPDIGDDMLWLLSDRNKKGFAQIPRPLPIFMNMIGDASKHVSPKAVPAGRSYLVLWCRVFSEALVKVENEMMAASEAGYIGERSVSTWREHMRVLKDLGFIDYKAGGAGPMHYILLLNPYKVAKNLRAKGWIQEVQYTTVFQRALEIGAGPEMA